MTFSNSCTPITLFSFVKSAKAKQTAYSLSIRASCTKIGLFIQKRKDFQKAKHISRLDS